ncbi:MAG: hypothetical protein K6G61_11825 [Solobacterium sp.]|nr:hypothetical protein [Solobacterium sp.]
MNQYQYQNKNPYDPFAQGEEDLQPQEKFHPSSMLMRDLESYARAEQKKKTFRFRMISLVVAALILGPLSLAGRSILRGRDYDYDPDFPEEIYGYEDVYQTYAFNYEGGADEYYDPGDGELGDELSEPELILEGTYYHLPAPLHVFIEDGWNIVYHDYDEEPPAVLEENWKEYITLEKEGKILQSVRIGSPSGETIPLENSYVLGFGLDKYGDIDVELPGGVRLDDDLDDVLENIKETGQEYVYTTDDWGGEVTVQKRLNTYGDYKYWRVRLSSYSEENTIDWIELDTDIYKY